MSDVPKTGSIRLLVRRGWGTLDALAWVRLQGKLLEARTEAEERKVYAELKQLEDRAKGDS